MKFYTAMPDKLKLFYRQELIHSVEFFEHDAVSSWRYLERAHILAQPYPYEHTVVHWKMLLFGFRIKSWKEVLGQIPRLIFGGVKSFVGRIPTGNTGGANVPALKSMKIPHDIAEIINHTNKTN